jgi:hypothetical protein
MIRRFSLSLLVCLLWSCVVVSAQPRPVAATTVVTTNTGTTSICSGANTINSPSTCTGGIKGGAIDASGTLNATGAATFGSSATVTGAATVGGVLTVNGFGSHTFSASGTGGNEIRVRNPTAGTTNYSGILFGNDNGPAVSVLTAQSTTYTTTSFNVQDGLTLAHTRPGGISIAASDAAGTIRFYSGGGTQRWVIGTSGNFNPIADATYNIGASSNSVARLFIAGGSAATPSLVVGGGTSDTGLFFAAGTSGGVSVALNGLDVAQFLNSSSTSLGRGLYVKDYNSSTREGATISLGRNISGTGAGGQVAFTRLGGTIDYVWSDNTGVLRTHTTAPLSSSAGSDTAGTVVGTQTSTRASKVIFGRETDTRRALNTLLNTPVWRFQYKSGAYAATEFVGITTDDSPQFGMDEGKSFNPVSAHGYTVLAIQELQKEIEALRKELADLKRRQAAVGF